MIAKAVCLLPYQIIWATGRGFVCSAQSLSEDGFIIWPFNSRICPVLAFYTHLLGKSTFNIWIKIQPFKRPQHDTSKSSTQNQMETGKNSDMQTLWNAAKRDRKGGLDGQIIFVWEKPSFCQRYFDGLEQTEGDGENQFLFYMWFWNHSTLRKMGTFYVVLKPQIYKVYHTFRENKGAQTDTRGLRWAIRKRKTGWLWSRGKSCCCQSMLLTGLARGILRKQAVDLEGQQEGKIQTAATAFQIGLFWAKCP